MTDRPMTNPDTREALADELRGKSAHMARVLARIITGIETSQDWRLTEDELFSINKASQHLQDIAALPPTLNSGAVTDEMVDAGAQALRDRQQGGKKLNPWGVLSNGSKRKWRDHAACVLTAALSLPRAVDGGAVEFINKRLEDLEQANALYGKDRRLNAPDKVARNDREISWLKDLRSILALPRVSTGGAAGEADDLERLVERFSKRLLAKLKLARANGRSGWEKDDWEADCQRGLLRHIEKGDPRDVAAYCAFMDHHGWITKSAVPLPLGGVGLQSEIDQLREALKFIGDWVARPPTAFSVGALDVVFKKIREKIAATLTFAHTRSEG